MRGRVVVLARAAALVLTGALLGVLVYRFAFTKTTRPANLRLVSIWPQSGRRVSFASFHGRPVVLNFWASWCGPCRREASLLRSEAQRENGRVVFIGLDVHDSTRDARAFLARYRIPYTVVRASDSALATYDITGLPQTLYVDKHGRVVARTVGQVTAGELQTNVLKLGS